MRRSVFVLFGSGPGIGISVAKTFARQHFDVLALCSRDTKRLQSERAEVAAAAKEAGREVQVIAFPTDLTDLNQLEQTLQAVQALGPLGCVYHNAARINYEQPLTTSPEDVEEDFRTGNLSLYVIAQWAVPLLKAGGNASPSFFVTNSSLPEQPVPVVISLSMSKASQQNFLMSLHQVYGNEIHFGLIKACGPVAAENAHLNPTNIAEKALELYEQKKGSWKLEIFIKDD